MRHNDIVGKKSGPAHRSTNKANWSLCPSIKPCQRSCSAFCSRYVADKTTTTLACIRQSVLYLKIVLNRDERQLGAGQATNRM